MDDDINFISKKNNLRTETIPKYVSEQSSTIRELMDTSIYSLACDGGTMRIDEENPILSRLRIYIEESDSRKKKYENFKLIFTYK